jgi:hypothetical protein
MLVSVVQLMHRPEVRIPSLVWVDTLDEVNRILPHACYFSVKRGFVIFGERSLLTDWEACLSRRFLAIRADESTSQVVERTPEALQDVTSEELNVRPDDRIAFEEIQEPFGIWISLYENGLRVRSEISEKDIEFTEALLGPL